MYVVTLPSLHLVIVHLNVRLLLYAILNCLLHVFLPTLTRKILVLFRSWLIKNIPMNATQTGQTSNSQNIAKNLKRRITYKQIPAEKRELF